MIIPDTAPAGQHHDGPRELTAWMRQRLTHITARARAARRATTAQVVVAPLGTTEDHTCDRCGAYLPDDQELVCFAVRPEPWLYITGGLCTNCWTKEAVPNA